MTVAVISCGALTSHIRDIVKRNNLDVHVESINPLLHNRPELIAGEVEQKIIECKQQFDQVIVGYADCGTYGALDALCESHNVQRLTGNHCYDVFATAEVMKREFESEPGTFVLTDYLLRSFDFSVSKQLGLDTYPELKDAYFGNYTRLLWLRQSVNVQVKDSGTELQVRDSELEQKAQQIAVDLGLRLEVFNVGDLHLERQLLALMPVG